VRGAEVARRLFSPDRNAATYAALVEEVAR
jgi:hypothetical protein